MKQLGLVLRVRHSRRTCRLGLIVTAVGDGHLYSPSRAYTRSVDSPPVAVILRTSAKCKGKYGRLSSGCFGAVPRRCVRLRPDRAGSGSGTAAHSLRRGRGVLRAVPTSTMRPSFIRQITSARCTVESRWAMTSVVRLRVKRPRASCTSRSDSVSRALVASSRRRIGRILQDCARECQALALATRQPQAALADHGVVAFGLRHDEFVRGRCLGGGHDAFLTRAEPAERDVGADRIVEQRHFLADDGNRIAQARKRRVPQVLTIDGYGAGLHVEQPCYKVDDGGFASTRAADERCGLAARHREREIP